MSQSRSQWKWYDPDCWRIGLDVCPAFGHDPTSFKHVFKIFKILFLIRAKIQKLFLCFFRERLSGMSVVIKMAGAGLFQSDVNRREKGLVSTARRLASLSQTARLRYGFRTVDTWNMTVARFRDFLPGRCRCHFHQVYLFPTTPIGNKKKKTKFLVYFFLWIFIIWISLLPFC